LARRQASALKTLTSTSHSIGPFQTPRSQPLAVRAERDIGDDLLMGIQTGQPPTVLHVRTDHENDAPLSSMKSRKSSQNRSSEVAMVPERVGPVYFDRRPIAL
jgi:hypothetical protein